MSLEKIYDYFRKYDKNTYQVMACQGIMVYCIAKAIPDFLDIRLKTKEFHDMGYEDYVPLPAVIGNGGEAFCFDKSGNIVLLDYYATGEATPFDGTFADCLMKQIEEPEECKNMKVKEQNK